MPTDSTLKTWSEVAKQQGVAWVLLTVLIIMNGAGLKMVFQEVPHHIATIAEGYDKNASELSSAADKFASSALSILNEYKKDRLADRQAMIELIRAGDLDSRQVADAFETANEKSRAAAANGAN